MRHDPKQLTKVAAVRQIQCQAAEIEVARSAAMLRECRLALAEAETGLEEARAGWHASVSDAVLFLHAAGLWRTEVLQRQKSMHESDRDVQRADTELAGCRRNWQLGLKRRDALTEMVREAMRSQDRRRDERALQDASDLHAKRWSRS